MRDREREVKKKDRERGDGERHNEKHTDEENI